MFFPNDYQFFANSRCTGAPRTDQTFELLKLLQEAFSPLDWGGYPNPLTIEFVADQTTAAMKRRRRDLNVPLGFTASSANVEVRIMIDTGARRLTPTDADSFNILFNGDFKKPDPTFWLRAIELLNPFMVRLGHSKNKHQVMPQERIHRNYPRKPSACLGLDYYDESIVNNLGGKAHVLNTPAHRTSEFLDGVLIELVPGFYLDPDNADHLEIQRRAMRHLGIDD